MHQIGKQLGPCVTTLDRAGLLCRLEPDLLLSHSSMLQLMLQEGTCTSSAGMLFILKGFPLHLSLL